MTQRKGKTGIILPLVLIGAVILSGVGLLGLFLQAADRGGSEDTPADLNSQMENTDMETARVNAEMKFDESFHQAEIARENVPSEEGISMSKGYSQPDLPSLPQGEEEVTRSSGEDDLLSDEGYISRESSPCAPDVEMDDTFSMIDGYSSVLEDTYEYTRKEDVPSTIPSVDVEEDTQIPVSEDGVTIDDDEIGDAKEELDGTSSDIEDLLGENTPSNNEAGIDQSDLSGTVWDISNSTVRDSDGDGNPEWKYEIRIAYGSVNRTFPNGTMKYTAGYEYEYRDSDSDGEPEYEKAVRIRIANYTTNGIKIAEGISYSEALKNDTDGDMIIDRIEIRHLSFGYHATILGTVKSYAVAGELLMDDKDADGAFETREATAVLFFKHETLKPSVTLREAFVIVHGKESEDSAEFSRIDFNRVNNTKGITVLEEARIRTYREDDSTRTLVFIAGKNNTVTGREQYVLLNASETVSSVTTTRKVTAYAVDNSSLLLGGKRSDAVALDLTEEITGNLTYEKGFLAASRTDNRQNRLDESFVLISVDRQTESDVISSEESMILTGKNVTTDGLNSTMAFAQRTYTDADADGNPEYLRESLAIGRNQDHDNDGIVDREAYAVHWEEIRDTDDDGNPEWNQTFNMLGWKLDSDDDGNVDTERGLMTNVTAYDENSNGYVELKETGVVGFEKVDEDLDGTLDTERYAGAWEKVTDVNDDGTEINTQSGTWAHEE